MKPVYIVVVLQDAPFPANVEAFATYDEAKEFADNAKIQYESNRVYIYERHI